MVYARGLVALCSYLAGCGAAEAAAPASRPDAGISRPIQQPIEMHVEVTPFVLDVQGEPRRRILARFTANDRPAAIAGRLAISFGDYHREAEVRDSAYVDGAIEVLIPEPARQSPLRLDWTSSPADLHVEQEVSPARPWTFYMTPHTHYDIGFTAPQPEVIERLIADMDTAVEFCGQTADWPPDSRYRWTIEVTSLFRHYASRRSPERVDKLLQLIRDGRIELCGFYLNMPTELLGHEELIRCLYDAQQIRDTYRVPIDTAMINDVPGYTWMLPQLFLEAGMPRVAFRANGIRGQFLWDRPGAVERPFYWESPAGQRLFVWYTDSYREGNFFRNPGPHEKAFLEIIQRNEQAGCRVNDIQLRMGGDNLPPDINTSRNARDWNRKYVWPKVKVATNREYLEALEKGYGPQCQAYCGDIPSWWADGPASSAVQTGTNRLTHDRLIAAEALWTLAHLAEPGLPYPHEQLRRAYDRMIHFDEHTWGSSGSITHPRALETQTQWEWKSKCAADADELARGLCRQAIERLSSRIDPPGPKSVAVWNTLAWARTDVVELPLAGTGLENAPALVAVDGQNGRRIPVQLSQDGLTAFFVARDVPPLACARYVIEQSAPSQSNDVSADERTLENGFYKLTLASAGQGWSGWHDNALSRELIDAKAGFAFNQAVYETPDGGRAAINRKQPVQMQRVAAKSGRVVSRSAGPVFAECTVETSLPFCPRIRQRLRLYHELKLVDVTNTVEKTENFEPELMHFAFPFELPSPAIRLEIADASMQPGKDQLAHSCQDFYSIQHWADVNDGGCGVIFVPMEAPLVTVGGLTAYSWADGQDFRRGYLFSQVANNTWTTNFKAGQSGSLYFRYRLTSYSGKADPMRAVRFAWQPFQPLQPVWLTPHPDEQAAFSFVDSWLRIEGDDVAITAVKLAEDSGSVILRLLEVRGRPAKCRLKIALPGMPIRRAFRADVVERPIEDLPARNGVVPLQLKPNQLATVGIVVSGLPVPPQN